MSGSELATIDGELTPRQLLNWLVATWPRRLVLGALVVVPLVIGLLGGFAPTPEQELRTFEHGETVDMGPYDLTLHDYFVAEELELHNLPEDSTAWLGVRATIEGNSNERVDYKRTLSLLPQEVADVVVNSAEPPQPAVQSMANRNVSYFYADMPVEVILLFAVDGTEAVDEDITMDLVSGVRLWSMMLESYSWYEGAPLGSVTIPRVDEVPEAFLPREDDLG